MAALAVPLPDPDMVEPAGVDGSIDMLAEVPAVVAGADAGVPPPPAHPLSPVKTAVNTSAVDILLLVMRCRPRRWRGLGNQPGFLP
jgi:hypothetical protein